MTRRIAINGLGRIGRGVLRVLTEHHPEIEVVAVNDLADISTLASLLQRDSVYGRFPETVSVVGDTLMLGDRRIRVLAEPDPAQLPWSELEVDVVFESTGRFTSASDARVHIDVGAQRVLVSAPSKGADLTVVVGLNDDQYDPAAHRIVSSASCTTNALAPLANVLNDVAGIEHGFMTTVHAYTQDQRLVDGPHADLRRARAAGLNLVPTSTGAAKAIGLVLPELDGKLTGYAIRVPVPAGSLVELNAVVSREVEREELLEAYRNAAEGPLAGLLEFSAEPLVSTDIVGNPAGAIFDSGLARVEGRHVKVVAWYDNEWGFSSRAAAALQLLTD